MKRSKSQTVRSTVVRVLAGVVVISSVLGGCARDESRFSTKTYRLPFPGDDGVYAVREIELKSYHEPEKFRGDVAQVFVEPHESNGQLAGEEPVGRYVKAGDGVLVPADFVSLQATTVYAHMERLHAIDEKLGIANVIRWPLKIGIQTNVMDQGRGVNNNAVYDGRLDALLIVPYTGAGIPIAMNAGVLAHEHFHTIFQSFVLSKVKESSVVVGKPGGGAGSGLESIFDDECSWGRAGAMPIMPMSPPTAPPTAPPTPTESPVPVPATEPQAKTRKKPIVSKRTVEDEETEKAAEAMPKRTYNGFLLRALNEGIADFWGWVYTGDQSFIQHSLPREGGVRRLDLDHGQLPSGKVIRATLVDLSREDRVRPTEQRVMLAYMLGTQYARFLRATAVEIAGEPTPGLEARMKAARALLEILPMIAMTAASEYDQSFLSPNFILKPLTLQMGKLSEKACEKLERFKADDKTFDAPASCPKKPTEEDEETPQTTGDRA